MKKASQIPVWKGHGRVAHRIFSQYFRYKWIGSNEHIFDEVSNMEEIKANKTETYHENESFKKLVFSEKLLYLWNKNKIHF